MQHKRLNDFECALFREYGYDWHVKRPTLSVATQWLREVKGLHITSRPDVGFHAHRWAYSIYELIGKDWRLYEQSKTFDTHDLALSAGITKALELLKNSNKR